MKFLIASDIHGSAYYCEQLLQAFEREQAARLLLLGDILYHGPRNDLPRDYAPHLFPSPRSAPGKPHYRQNSALPSPAPFR